MIHPEEPWGQFSQEHLNRGMNRNLNPMEFNSGQLGEAEDEAGLYLDEPEIQVGFARSLAQPDRRPTSTSADNPEYMPMDGDWRAFAPETQPTGPALAAWITGDLHPSQRN